MIPDNVFEKQEEFKLKLNVPSLLGPAIIAGRRNKAKCVITDS